MKSGFLGSDIDGTLAFHARLHGMVKIAEHADGMVTVRDPDGALHRAHDVSTPLYAIYFADSTRQLLLRLREHYTLVLVSAARAVSLRQRPALHIADAYILENGACIYDAAWQEDAAWAQRLTPQRALLQAYARSLEREGWRLDTAGRTAGIRLRPEDNPQWDVAAYAARLAALTLPDGLARTTNLGYTDILPAAAGKGNAVDWLRERLGYSVAASIGIGDDVNDLDFLTRVGQAWLPGSAVPDVLAVARAHGLTVVPQRHVAGIDTILTRLLAS